MTRTATPVKSDPYDVRMGPCEACHGLRCVTYSEHKRSAGGSGRYLCWSCHDAMLAAREKGGAT